MRAAVVERYGGPEVVHVADVPLPEPGAEGVRVRVDAAAVTSGDARIRAARFPPGFGVVARPVFGIRRPRRRILGSAFSGVVDAVGERVGDLAPGEAVCGMAGSPMGAHAQYVVVPAKKLVRTPAGVSHEDAAGVLFGGTTALHFLRDKASVGPGTSVLVNGASGAVGTNAVQLATHFGGSVTGVTSAANAALVTDLGAERVIDHTRVDPTEIDDRFDIVLDTVGNLSITSGRRLLRDGGTLVLVVASLGEMIRARGAVVAGPAPERVDDMALLLGLVADGELTVVHDQTFDLDHIVDAHRLVDGGHKRGNVVVCPWPTDGPTNGLAGGSTGASTGG
jgi:NADPH:quinone reductase-like Zn-dependent oxidoreductase